ncbi:MATE family efflux transporter [Kamptonema sp. UHCC 0994]|uniref:MATE family efflux transporter n=1 Tax=Kamptonema sp. UHCC 0994 TaxID=3031329 RepID=UPI0023B98086|nr:MATE family efflux transporter [Kamptonema sp. UHCC 0994]MDF0552317.1 MATE family efflux transporter [Kamptonema sp. UHCC 0994]
MEQITSTEFNSELLTEARVSLELAVPLAFAQLAQTSIPVVNSVMMGLLGTQNLAAGALGAITFITVSSICLGILSAGGALAAEAFGAKNIEQVSRINCQGLWLAATLSLPAMLLLWNCDFILLLLGQEESNVLLTKSYLHTLVWGVPPAISFLYLKRIASVINFPQFGMVIIVISLLLNVPTNYVLMFGYLGFPALGLAGIGWGTALVYWVSLLASCSIIYFHPKSRDYKLFRYLYQFDREVFFQIFQTGWPTGIQIGMELGLLAVTAMLMGKLGTSSLAGHEIAIQTSEFFLAIPIAISYSATARVGQMMGEKNTVGSIRAAVVYQIFFSIQFIAVGALLGLQDTRVPMLINIFSLWSIGMGGGYLMAITLGWGGVGFWYGLILGLAISDLILMVRFYLVNFNKIAQRENADVL